MGETTRQNGPVERLIAGGVLEPMRGGSVAHWRHGRGGRRLRHLVSARLRHADIRDLIDKGDDLL